MGNDVTVASTTDTQDEVNQAAGGVPQNEEQPELKPPPTGDQQVESGEPVPESEQQPEKKPEDQPPPKNLSKKFDKLYREKKELEERLAALEARQNGQPAPEKPPEIPTEVAAKFDTFDSWSEKRLAEGKLANIDDFLEARDAWKEARDQQKAEKEAIAQAEQEIETTYQETVDAFKAQHEDWDEVVGESEISIPTVVGNAIKQLENGPDVVYYLAKNPKEAQQIADLPPVRAVAEIGRIAARLEKAAPEGQETNATQNRGPDRPPIVSKAPAPIKPLSGHAVRTTPDLNDPNLSFAEYRRIRAEQEKAQFRR